MLERGSALSRTHVYHAARHQQPTIDTPQNDGDNPTRAGEPSDTKRMVGRAYECAWLSAEPLPPPPVPNRTQSHLHVAAGLRR